MASTPTTPRSDEDRSAPTRRSDDARPADAGSPAGGSTDARTAAGRSAALGRGGPDPLLPHLRRARDLADRHYADPLDLDALAAAARVSKYHFARRFAEAYGETPIRYLTRRRIERAQDLLRAANLTVTEICMMVGFSSLGSFSSRFRQLVGESPTRYRDRWAARCGPHIPGCFLFMRGIDRWPAAGAGFGSPPGPRDAPPAPTSPTAGAPAATRQDRNLREAPRTSRFVGSSS